MTLYKSLTLFVFCYCYCCQRCYTIKESVINMIFLLFESEIINLKQLKMQLVCGGSVGE